MIEQFLHDMDLDGEDYEEVGNIYSIPTSFNLVLEKVLTKSYLHNSVSYLGSTRIEYYSYKYVNDAWTLFKVLVTGDNEQIKVEFVPKGSEVISNNMSFVV